MTRKEWIREHHPEAIKKGFWGGVLGCPKGYPLLCRMDQSIREDPPCVQHGLECKTSSATCERCWNKEMEVAQ